MAVEFLKPEILDRDWGQEVIVIHTKDFTGKLLKMKAGTRGGLQYHQKKNEASYLFSGEALLEYDSGDGKITSVTLKEGQSIHIPPGSVHRETAITDCVFFEVSNPVFNDRVRVEEKYGEKVEGGLPSTTEAEIRIG